MICFLNTKCFVNLYSKRISGATLKIHLKVGFISQHFVKIVLEAIHMELIFGERKIRELKYCGIHFDDICLLAYL